MEPSPSFGDQGNEAVYAGILLPPQKPKDEICDIINEGKKSIFRQFIKSFKELLHYFYFVIFTAWRYTNIHIKIFL